jgi:hypothetical protein
LEVQARNLLGFSAFGLFSLIAKSGLSWKPIGLFAFGLFSLIAKSSRIHAHLVHVCASSYICFLVFILVSI